MKQLVVYCHPNPKSFCSALKDRVIEAYNSMGDEVVLRDLYGLGFDPVLKGPDFEALQRGEVSKDLKVEQDCIAWSDIMTFIYPIWWTGLPAVLKGYIDRVFSYGFAYAIDEDRNIKQLLKGKRAVIINTMGTSEEVYRQSGMIDAMQMTTDTGIFGFCGIDVIAHRFFGAVPFVDDATRSAMLEDVTSVVKGATRR